MFKINKKEYKTKNGLDYSFYRFNVQVLDSSDYAIVTSILNVLRETLMRDIPIYAFPPELITIDKAHTNTIFNNDQLKLRFSQLPVYLPKNIKPEIIPDYLSSSLDLFRTGKYVPANYSSDGSIPTEDLVPTIPNIPEIDINLDSSTLNKEKSNNSLINITTNDIKFYVNNNEVENPYPKDYPILLISLREGQKIAFHLKAAVNTARRNVIWQPVARCWNNPISDSEFIFRFESNGQIPEPILIKKALQCIFKRLDSFYEKIKNHYDQTQEQNEEYKIHSFSNTPLMFLIAAQLQKMDGVISAGAFTISYLNGETILSIKLNKPNQFLPIIKEAFKNIKNSFQIFNELNA